MVQSTVTIEPVWLNYGCDYFRLLVFIDIIDNASYKLKWMNLY
jgi:hypothetical protein